MELGEKTIYDMELAPDQRSALLAPYYCVLTLDTGLTMEFGRCSLDFLSRIRLIANDRDRCVLRVGSFVESAVDSLVMIGGEHRNDAFWNFAFSGLALGFRSFISEEDRPLASVEEAGITEIGDCVTLSARVTVLDGARIGAGTVIGAGALVRAECGSYGIYAGIPARRRRDRFSPSAAELHRQARVPDVMAHCIPKMPRLMAQLQSGEIGLDQYLSSVSFLPVRPVVHLAGSRTSTGAVEILRVTGYSLGSAPVTDQTAVAELNGYFAQMTAQGATGKVKWTADAFHTLGLY
jgi:acetyltransferase-like isoleucine patch superfamily enzyme